MDTEDQIPPSLPLPSGPEALLGRRQKGGIPLFGKEGLGKIFWRICLLNYGLLSISLCWNLWVWSLKGSSLPSSRKAGLRAGRSKTSSSVRLFRGYWGGGKGGGILCNQESV